MAVEEEIARIVPPAPLFEKAAESIHDLAMKAIRAKELTAEINEEIARITHPDPVFEEPPEVFSITAAAEKRREAEELRKEIDHEYERLYGDSKTGFDHILDVLGEFRGTIGGFGGAIVGSLWDIARMLGNTKQTAERASRAVAAAQNMMGPGDALPEGAQGGGIAQTLAEGIPYLPVAAIAAKIQYAAIEAYIGGIKWGMSTLGGIAAGVASADTDPARPIAALGDVASRAGEKLAKFDLASGALVVVIGETAKAFGAVMQALDGTVKRYGEYNQDVAREEALADIRLVRGDIRRSQEVGPNLANYVRAQSELKDSIEDLKVKLLTPLLPFITTSVNSFTLAVDSLNVLTDLGKISVEALTLQLPSAIADMQDFLKRMANKPTLVDPTDMIFRQAPILPSGPGIGP